MKYVGVEIQNYYQLVYAFEMERIRLDVASRILFPKLAEAKWRKYASIN